MSLVLLLLGLNSDLRMMLSIVWIGSRNSNNLFLSDLRVIALIGSCGRRTQRSCILPWRELPLVLLNIRSIWCLLTQFLRRWLINFSYDFRGYSILGFHTMHKEWVFISYRKVSLVLFVSHRHCLGLDDLRRQGRIVFGNILTNLVAGVRIW